MAVNFAKLPELLRGPPPISGGELYGSAAPAGRRGIAGASRATIRARCGLRAHTIPAERAAPAQ